MATTKPTTNQSTESALAQNDSKKSQPSTLPRTTFAALSFFALMLICLMVFVFSKRLFTNIPSNRQPVAGWDY